MVSYSNLRRKLFPQAVQKDLRGEARTNRDRVGQRGREIHEHEHANTHTNSSETIERQRSIWVFFISLLEFFV
jgi:hypothetical protein